MGSNTQDTLKYSDVEPECLKTKVLPIVLRLCSKHGVNTTKSVHKGSIWFDRSKYYEIPVATGVFVHYGGISILKKIIYRDESYKTTAVGVSIQVVDQTAYLKCMLNSVIINEKFSLTSIADLEHLELRASHYLTEKSKISFERVSQGLEAP